MMISVFRDADGFDCTLDGVSAKHKRLWVRMPEYSADQTGPDDIPHMRLESHYEGCVRLVPEGEHRWCSFGGNFGYTSDSRFRQAIERLLGTSFYGAIPIHDRIENKD